MRAEASEPILPTRNVAESCTFYESLGFAAGYHHDAYEILRRGNLVVHLERSDDLRPEHNHFSCYWRVADADRLYREFAALGLPRLSAPADEPWGMREFTLKDPSGNLIRVGHELQAPR